MCGACMFTHMWLTYVCRYMCTCPRVHTEPELELGYLPVSFSTLCIEAEFLFLNPEVTLSASQLARFEL